MTKSCLCGVKEAIEKMQKTLGCKKLTNNQRKQND